jgi:metal-sulfur cluster biosynthetic enzyme
MSDQEQQPVQDQPLADAQPAPEATETDAQPAAAGAAPEAAAQAAAGAAPDAPPVHPEVVTEEDIYEALEEVIDPELGLDFVSLGLVYDVAIEQEDVYVTFTLTTPACPIGPQVSEQMKEFVGDLPGVSAVHPKMVFEPSWSPEMMSEDAKFALGF